MEIIFNGEKESLDRECTVKELLDKFEFNPDVVTVGLNGNVLSREDFETVQVKAGDAVDVLMFMGGGQ